MGFAVAGIPYRKGGVQAAMDVVAAHHAHARPVAEAAA